MSFDLFAQPDLLEPIPMEGADVSFLPNADFGLSAQVLFEKFRDEIVWQERTINVYGKSMLQPRLVAWYGEQGKEYSYSGISFTSLPFTDTLLLIKSKIEALCGSTFNSVLLNYYRDENDSIAMHSDSERELGTEPVIASVSFGETRTFLFKSNLTGETVKLPLLSGSVLLMKGETQKNWKHGINKESQRCAGRINLTFRTIY